MLELGANQGGHAHAADRRVLRLDKFSLKTFSKKVLGGVLGGFLSSRAVRGGKNSSEGFLKRALLEGHKHTSSERTTPCVCPI